MKAVRGSVYSGTFYSNSSHQLSYQLSTLLNKCSFKNSDNCLYGLIVPHAGYMYSGSVAASGFSKLKDRQYDRIVIIGPSHRHSFSGASIYDGSGYETPLGVISMDEHCISKIRNHSDSISFIPLAHEQEHSIEVELPFIQALFKNNIPIVPIVIGDKSAETIQTIATTLHEVCSNNTLFIASSDFSHFYTDSRAREMDYRAKDLILNMKLEQLFKEDDKKTIEMCGLSPILIMAMIMKKRGFNSIDAYQYSNSGDVSNDKTSVVGYWSIGYS
jgi:MEMO1 family protein